MSQRGFALSCCLVLGACSGSPPAAPAPDRLAAFEVANGIRDWPQLQGCGYDRPFAGTVVGVVLDVRSPASAYARETGCKVPPEHGLAGWPEHLPPGRYVVAVTTDYGHHDIISRHFVLQVVAVLGERPDDEASIVQAMARICAAPGPADSDDRQCASRR